MSALLSNTEFDPLTLKETMRLLHTSLCNEVVSEMWVKVIRENPYVKQLIIFCFESSTNSECTTFEEFASSSSTFSFHFFLSRELAARTVSAQLLKNSLLPAPLFHSFFFLKQRVSCMYSECTTFEEFTSSSSISPFFLF